MGGGWEWLTQDSNTGQLDSNSALAMTHKVSEDNPQVFDILPLSVSSCALKCMFKKRRILREEDFSLRQCFPNFFNVIIPQEPF